MRKGVNNMKKRNLNVFLALTTLLVLTVFLSIGVSAETSGNYEYTVGTSGAEITRYIGNEQTVVIPSSLDQNAVVSIAANAFENCKSIQALTIPSNITSIGTAAFRYCTALETVNVSASIVKLSDQVFSCCTSLTNVTLPQTITSIGFRSFYGCSSLTSFTIGASVNTIGDEALSNCDSLTQIAVAAGNTVYKSENGILFSANGNTLICFPSGIAGDYTVPSTVTTISDYAFRSSNNVTSVTIPSGVTSIGIGAFLSAKSLCYVVVPSSVTSIGYKAFDLCGRLNTAYVARSSIAEMYFEQTKPEIALVYLDDFSKGDYELSSEIKALAGLNKFEVKINLSKNEGFASITFDVNFDNSKLQLESVSKGTFLASTLNTEEPGTILSNLDTVKYFYACANDVTGTGELLTLTFVKIGNFDTNDIELSLISIYNKDIAFITPLMTADNITVPGSVPVTFNACSGTFSSGNSTMVSNIFDTFPAVTRPNYSFIGWYTEAVGGTKIESGTGIVPGSITNLYAHWAVNAHTVSFDAGSETPAPDSIVVIEGAEYGTLPTITRTGYDFDGWYTEAVGGTKIEATTTVTITEDQILYAHFTAKTYTVTINACGGTADRSQLTVTYGLPYGLLPTATKANNRFVGWYTAETGGEVVTSDTIFMSNQNITIYAHWVSTIGDISNDGLIDINDSVMLSQYLAHWDIEINLSNADCNGDGKVDIRDAVKLSQFLAGWDIVLG